VEATVPVILRGGDSVKVRVTFTPNAVGAVADTVVITHNNSAQSPLRVPMSGTGINPLRITNPRTGANLTSLAFTDVLGGQEQLDSVTIKNDGTASVTVSAVTFGHAAFSTTNTLPVIIAGRDSLKLMLRFLNNAARRERATLSIVHNSAITGSSPLTLPVTARSHGHLRFALAGVFLDNEDTVRVSFASAGTRNGTLVPPVAIDSGRTGLITVRNLTAGAPTIRIDSITFTGPHFSSITPTPYDHRPGAAYDRILQYLFKPKVQAPVLRDTIVVWTNDTIPGGNRITMLVEGASTRRVTIRDEVGTGTAQAFGDVPLGTSVNRRVRVLNFQDVSLTIDSLRFAARDAKYSIVSAANNITVPRGDTAFITIRFSANDTLPNLASTHPDTLLVYANFFGTTPGRLPLSGRVVSSVLLSATSVNFGSLRLNATKDSTIKIYNRTSTAYRIDSLALRFYRNFTIQSNVLTTQLRAGDSVGIDLQFKPVDAGLVRDTLRIYHTFAAPNPRVIPLVGTGTTQAIIDPSNYITVDNVRGLDGFPTRSADTSYVETGPFWQNASALDFGGTATGHRRSPNLAGSPNGSSARWTFHVDQTAPYLIYHYIQSSPNTGQNYYVHFRKFGVGGIVDSLRYSMQSNITSFFGGSWYPLMYHMIDGVGPNAASITIGADATSTAFMRVDAVRLLRSTQRADLEFGRRAIDFGPTRVPEEYGQITLGDELVRNYRLYNLGSDTLVISDIKIFATTTPVPWFYTKNTSFPIRIPPLRVGQSGQQTGGFYDLQLAFSPFQEGSARDSIVIFSNDENESAAYNILTGEGLNYNFIMNASAGNTEPHFRAPRPPEVSTEPRYRETAVGNWQPSVAAQVVYPIPAGNPTSRVNLSGLTTALQLPQQASYEFELPEIALGKIRTDGRYILEYGGPISANGYTQTLVKVRHSFGVPPDSAYYSSSTNLPWVHIGGSAKTFFLSPGGQISIDFIRNEETQSRGGTGGLRVDLLRIRKVPTGALIGVNIAQGASIQFGDVSYRNPAGLDGRANKREVTIGSRGESQIVVNNIRFRDGRYFRVVSPPSFPLFLRALTGEYKLTIEFVPDRIFNGYVDTLEIRSNSTRDSVLTIPVAGNGIGGVYVFDDDGPDASISFTPPRAGLYLNTWDRQRMNNWQIQTHNEENVIGRGKTRAMLPIYFNGNASVSWFPLIPADPSQRDSVLMNVAVTIPRGASKLSPRARYKVFSTGGNMTKDTLVSQNTSPTPGQSNVIEINLGNHWFLRGGRDIAGGQAFFGHVRLENDTGAVSAAYPAGTTNFARRDTFALLADAVILRELDAAQPTITNVEDETVPLTFSLSQNYPNPFNPTTNIRFTLPERLPVDLRVYDILGREIAVILRGDELNAGVHTVRWDGKNNYGQSVSTGVYFYRIIAGGYVQSKKMVLVK
jgi:hypothetical protein